MVKRIVIICKKYGFKIIGRTPKGGRINNHDFVDTLIMYKSLEDEC